MAARLLLRSAAGPVARCVLKRAPLIVKNNPRKSSAVSIILLNRFHTTGTCLTNVRPLWYLLPSIGSIVGYTWSRVLGPFRTVGIGSQESNQCQVHVSRVEPAELLKRFDIGDHIFFILLRVSPKLTGLVSTRGSVFECTYLPTINYWSKFDCIRYSTDTLF